METIIVGPNEKENNERFGDILETYRRRLNLSRVAAAEALKISSEYLRLIELGQRVPAFGTVPDILKLYKIEFYMRERSIIFNDYQVVFTSRILETRRRTERTPISKIRTQHRDQTVGHILRLLVSADDETVDAIYDLLRE